MNERDVVVIKAKEESPRLTLEDIESVIVGEDYYVFPNTTLTVCCLVLKNGFTVTGESATVSPDNFNEEIGRRVAKQRAVNKIWMLEGYLLKQHIHDLASGR